MTEQEQLRELAKRVRSQLPEGTFYSLVLWAPGQPETVAYISNSHKAEAMMALESILGKAKEP